MAEDLTDMADVDLRRLVDDIQTELVRREQQRVATATQREQAIRDASTDLDTLIGPDSPAVPAMTSLTEVRLYTRQQMQDNAGLGLELAFQGLELLARTVRNIAAAR